MSKVSSLSSLEEGQVSLCTSKAWNTANDFCNVSWSIRLIETSLLGIGRMFVEALAHNGARKLCSRRAECRPDSDT